jgi:hypothetical protein
MPSSPTPAFDSAAALALARRVLHIEAQALETLRDRLDDSFIQAMQLIPGMPWPRGGERHG